MELTDRLAGAGNADAAERMLLVNLEFNPGSGQSMVALAEIYGEGGNVEDALRWYRAAEGRSEPLRGTGLRPPAPL